MPEGSIDLIYQFHSDQLHSKDLKDRKEKKVLDTDEIESKSSEKRKGSEGIPQKSFFGEKSSSSPLASSSLSGKERMGDSAESDTEKKALRTLEESSKGVSQLARGEGRAKKFSRDFSRVADFFMENWAGFAGLIKKGRAALFQQGLDERGSLRMDRWSSYERGTQLDEQVKSYAAQQSSYKKRTREEDEKYYGPQYIHDEEEGTVKDSGRSASLKLRFSSSTHSQGRNIGGTHGSQVERAYRGPHFLVKDGNESLQEFSPKLVSLRDSSDPSNPVFGFGYAHQREESLYPLRGDEIDSSLTNAFHEAKRETKRLIYQSTLMRVRDKTRQKSPKEDAQGASISSDEPLISMDEEFSFLKSNFVREMLSSKFDEGKGAGTFRVGELDFLRGLPEDQQRQFEKIAHKISEDNQNILLEWLRNPIIENGEEGSDTSVVKRKVRREILGNIDQMANECDRKILNASFSIIDGVNPEDRLQLIKNFAKSFDGIDDLYKASYLGILNNSGPEEKCDLLSLTGNLSAQATSTQRQELICTLQALPEQSLRDVLKYMRKSELYATQNDPGEQLDILCLATVFRPGGTLDEQEITLRDNYIKSVLELTAQNRLDRQAIKRLLYNATPEVVRDTLEFIEDPEGKTWGKKKLSGEPGEALCEAYARLKLSNATKDDEQKKISPDEVKQVVGMIVDAGRKVREKISPDFILPVLRSIDHIIFKNNAIPNFNRETGEMVVSSSFLQTKKESNVKDSSRITYEFFHMAFTSALSPVESGVEDTLTFTSQLAGLYSRVRENPESRQKFIDALGKRYNELGYSGKESGIFQKEALLDAGEFVAHLGTIMWAEDLKGKSGLEAVDEKGRRYILESLPPGSVKLMGDWTGKRFSEDKRVLAKLSDESITRIKGQYTSMASQVSGLLRESLRPIKYQRKIEDASGAELSQALANVSSTKEGANGLVNVIDTISNSSGEIQKNFLESLTQMSSSPVGVRFLSHVMARVSSFPQGSESLAEFLSSSSETPGRLQTLLTGMQNMVSSPEGAKNLALFFEKSSSSAGGVEALRKLMGKLAQPEQDQASQVFMSILGKISESSENSLGITKTFNNLMDTQEGKENIKAFLQNAFLFSKDGIEVQQVIDRIAPNGDEYKELGNFLKGVSSGVSEIRSAKPSQIDQKTEEKVTFAAPAESPSDWTLSRIETNREKVKGLSDPGNEEYKYFIAVSGSMITKEFSNKFKTDETFRNNCIQSIETFYRGVGVNEDKIAEFKQQLEKGDFNELNVHLKTVLDAEKSAPLQEIKDKAKQTIISMGLAENVEGFYRDWRDGKLINNDNIIFNSALMGVDKDSSDFKKIASKFLININNIENKQQKNAFISASLERLEKITYDGIKLDTLSSEARAARQKEASSSDTLDGVRWDELASEARQAKIDEIKKGYLQNPDTFTKVFGDLALKTDVDGKTGLLDEKFMNPLKSVFSGNEVGEQVSYADKFTDWVETVGGNIVLTDANSKEICGKAASILKLGELSPKAQDIFKKYGIDNSVLSNMFETKLEKDILLKSLGEIKDEMLYQDSVKGSISINNAKISEGIKSLTEKIAAVQPSQIFTPAQVSAEIRTETAQVISAQDVWTQPARTEESKTSTSPVAGTDSNTQTTASSSQTADTQTSASQTTFAGQEASSDQRPPTSTYTESKWYKELQPKEQEKIDKYIGELDILKRDSLDKKLVGKSLEEQKRIIQEEVRKQEEIVTQKEVAKKQQEDVKKAAVQNFNEKKLQFKPDTRAEIEKIADNLSEEEQMKFYESFQAVSVERVSEIVSSPDYKKFGEKSVADAIRLAGIFSQDAGKDTKAKEREDKLIQVTLELTKDSLLDRKNIVQLMVESRPQVAEKTMEFISNPDANTYGENAFNEKLPIKIKEVLAEAYARLKVSSAIHEEGGIEWALSQENQQKMVARLVGAVRGSKGEISSDFLLANMRELKSIRFKESALPHFDINSRELVLSSSLLDPNKKMSIKDMSLMTHELFHIAEYAELDTKNSGVIGSFDFTTKVTDLYCTIQEELPVREKFLDVLKKRYNELGYSGEEIKKIVKECLSSASEFTTHMATLMFARDAQGKTGKEVGILENLEGGVEKFIRNWVGGNLKKDTEYVSDIADLLGYTPSLFSPRRVSFAPSIDPGVFEDPGTGEVDFLGISKNYMRSLWNYRSDEYIEKEWFMRLSVSDFKNTHETRGAFTLQKPADSDKADPQARIDRVMNDIPEALRDKFKTIIEKQADLKARAEIAELLDASVKSLEEADLEGVINWLEGSKQETLDNLRDILRVLVQDPSQKAMTVKFLEKLGNFDQGQRDVLLQGMSDLSFETTQKFYKLFDSLSEKELAVVNEALKNYVGESGNLKIDETGLAEVILKVRFNHVFGWSSIEAYSPAQKYMEVLKGRLGENFSEYALTSVLEVSDDQLKIEGIMAGFSSLTKSSTEVSALKQGFCDMMDKLPEAQRKQFLDLIAKAGGPYAQADLASALLLLYGKDSQQGGSGMATEVIGKQDKEAELRGASGVSDKNGDSMRAGDDFGRILESLTAQLSGLDPEKKKEMLDKLLYALKDISPELQKTLLNKLNEISPEQRALLLDLVSHNNSPQEKELLINMLCGLNQRQLAFIEDLSKSEEYKKLTDSDKKAAFLLLGLALAKEKDGKMESLSDADVKLISDSAEVLLGGWSTEDDVYGFKTIRNLLACKDQKGIDLSGRIRRTMENIAKSKERLDSSSNKDMVRNEIMTIANTELKLQIGEQKMTIDQVDDTARNLYKNVFSGWQNNGLDAVIDVECIKFGDNARYGDKEVIVTRDTIDPNMSDGTWVENTEEFTHAEVREGYLNPDSRLYKYSMAVTMGVPMDLWERYQTDEKFRADFNAALLEFHRNTNMKESDLQELEKNLNSGGIKDFDEFITKITLLTKSAQSGRSALETEANNALSAMGLTDRERQFFVNMVNGDLPTNDKIVEMLSSIKFEKKDGKITFIIDDNITAYIGGRKMTGQQIREELERYGISGNDFETLRKYGMNVDGLIQTLETAQVAKNKYDKERQSYDELSSGFGRFGGFFSLFGTSDYHNARRDYRAAVNGVQDCWKSNLNDPNVKNKLSDPKGHGSTTGSEKEDPYIQFLKLPGSSKQEGDISNATISVTTPASTLSVPDSTMGGTSPIDQYYLEWWNYIEKVRMEKQAREEDKASAAKAEEVAQQEQADLSEEAQKQAAEEQAKAEAEAKRVAGEETAKKAAEEAKKLEEEARKTEEAKKLEDDALKKLEELKKLQKKASQLRSEAEDLQAEAEATKQDNASNSQKLQAILAKLERLQNEKKLLADEIKKSPVSDLGKSVQEVIVKLTRMVETGEFESHNTKEMLRAFLSMASGKDGPKMAAEFLKRSSALGGQNLIKFLLMTGADSEGGAIAARFLELGTSTFDGAYAFMNVMKNMDMEQISKFINLLNVASSSLNGSISIAKALQNLIRSSDGAVTLSKFILTASSMGKEARSLSQVFANMSLSDSSAQLLADMFIKISYHSNASRENLLRAFFQIASSTEGARALSHAMASTSSMREGGKAMALLIGEACQSERGIGDLFSSLRKIASSSEGARNLAIFLERASHSKEGAEALGTALAKFDLKSEQTKELACVFANASFSEEGSITLSRAFQNIIKLSGNVERFANFLKSVTVDGGKYMGQALARMSSTEEGTRILSDLFVKVTSYSGDSRESLLTSLRQMTMTGEGARLLSTVISRVSSIPKGARAISKLIQSSSGTAEGCETIFMALRNMSSSAEGARNIASFMEQASSVAGDSLGSAFRNMISRKEGLFHMVGLFSRLSISDADAASVSKYLLTISKEHGESILDFFHQASLTSRERKALAGIFQKMASTKEGALGLSALIGRIASSQENSRIFLDTCSSLISANEGGRMLSSAFTDMASFVEGKKGLSQFFAGASSTSDGAKLLSKVFSGISVQSDDSPNIVLQSLLGRPDSPRLAANFLSKSAVSHEGVQNFMKLLSGTSSNLDGSLVVSMFLQAGTSYFEGASALHTMLYNMKSHPQDQQNFAQILNMASQTREGSAAIGKTLQNLGRVPEGVENIASFLGSVTKTAEGARNLSQALAHITSSGEGGRALADLFIKISSYSPASRVNVLQSIYQMASSQEGAEFLSYALANASNVSAGEKAIARLVQMASETVPGTAMLFTALKNMSSSVDGERNMAVFIGKSALTTEGAEALGKAFRSMSATVEGTRDIASFLMKTSSSTEGASVLSRSLLNITKLSGNESVLLAFINKASLDQAGSVDLVNALRQMSSTPEGAQDLSHLVARLSKSGEGARMLLDSFSNLVSNREFAQSLGDVFTNMGMTGEGMKNLSHFINKAGESPEGVRGLLKIFSEMSTGDIPVRNIVFRALGGKENSLGAASLLVYGTSSPETMRDLVKFMKQAGTRDSEGGLLVARFLQAACMSGEGVLSLQRMIERISSVYNGHDELVKILSHCTSTAEGAHAIAKVLENMCRAQEGVEKFVSFMRGASISPDGGTDLSRVLGRISQTKDGAHILAKIFNVATSHTPSTFGNLMKGLTQMSISKEGGELLSQVLAQTSGSTLEGKGISRFIQLASGSSSGVGGLFILMKNMSGSFNGARNLSLFLERSMPDGVDAFGRIFGAVTSTPEGIGDMAALLARASLSTEGSMALASALLNMSDMKRNIDSLTEFIVKASKDPRVGVELATALKQMSLTAEGSGMLAQLLSRLTVTKEGSRAFRESLNTICLSRDGSKLMSYALANLGSVPDGVKIFSRLVGEASGNMKESESFLGMLRTMVAHGEGGRNVGLFLERVSMSQQGAEALSRLLKMQSGSAVGLQVLSEVLSKASSSSEGSVGVSCALLNMSRVSGEEVLEVFQKASYAPKSADALSSALLQMSGSKEGSRNIAELISLLSKEGSYDLLRTMAHISLTSSRGRALAGVFANIGSMSGGAAKVSKFLAEASSTPEGIGMLHQVFSSMSLSSDGAKALAQFFEYASSTGEGALGLMNVLANLTGTKEGMWGFTGTLLRCAASGEGGLAISKSFSSMCDSEAGRREAGRFLMRAAQDSETALALSEALVGMSQTEEGARCVGRFILRSGVSPEVQHQIMKAFIKMAETVEGARNLSRVLANISYSDEGSIYLSDFMNKATVSSDGSYLLLSLLTKMMSTENGAKDVAKFIVKSSENLVSGQSIAGILKNLSMTVDGTAKFFELVNKSSQKVPYAGEALSRALANLTLQPSGIDGSGNLLKMSLESSEGVQALMLSLLSMSSSKQGATNVAQFLANYSRTPIDSMALLGVFSRIINMESGLRDVSKLLEQCTSTQDGARTLSKALVNLTSSREGNVALGNLVLRLSSLPDSASSLSRTLVNIAYTGDEGREGSWELLFKLTSVNPQSISQAIKNFSKSRECVENLSVYLQKSCLSDQGVSSVEDSLLHLGFTEDGAESLGGFLSEVSKSEYGSKVFVEAIRMMSGDRVSQLLEKISSHVSGAVGIAKYFQNIGKSSELSREWSKVLGDMSGDPVSVKSLTKWVQNMNRTKMGQEALLEFLIKSSESVEGGKQVSRFFDQQATYPQLKNELEILYASGSEDSVKLLREHIERGRREQILSGTKSSESAVLVRGSESASRVLSDASASVHKRPILEKRGLQAEGGRQVMRAYAMEGKIRQAEAQVERALVERASDRALSVSMLGDRGIAFRQIAVAIPYAINDGGVSNAARIASSERDVARTSEIEGAREVRREEAAIDIKKVKAADSHTPKEQLKSQSHFRPMDIYPESILRYLNICPECGNQCGAREMFCLKCIVKFEHEIYTQSAVKFKRSGYYFREHEDKIELSSLAKTMFEEEEIMLGEVLTLRRPPQFPKYQEFLALSHS